MLDIDGYLTSTEFVAQIAALIAAILSTVLGTFINGWFSRSA